MPNSEQNQHRADDARRSDKRVDSSAEDFTSDRSAEELSDDRSRDPSADPGAEQPGHGLGRFLIFLLLCLVVGVSGLFAYFRQELARIEPTTRLLLCLEELPMLLWFCWFVYRNRNADPQRHSQPCDSARLPAAWWLAVLTITATLACKAYTAWELRAAETAALRNSLMADGQITQIRRRVRAAAVIYFYQGEFLDRGGQRHRFHHSANQRQAEGWLQPLSQATRQALEQGQVPAAISIAYDPNLPGRNWAEGILDEQWRLYKPLGYLVIIQAVFFYNFAVALAYHIRQKREIPWWHDLHLAVPLVVTLVALAFAGLMVGVFNRLLDLAFGG